MSKKLVGAMDAVLGYFDLTDLEGLALACGIVGLFVCLLVSPVAGIAVLLLAVVIGVIAGFHFMLHKPGTRPVTLIQIPAEPEADPEDKNTWAAAVVRVSDVSRTPLMLGQVNIWDDKVEHLDFRVLVGDEPMLLAVVGAGSGELVATTSQWDPQYQEALV